MAWVMRWQIDELLFCLCTEIHFVGYGLWDKFLFILSTMVSAKRNKERDDDRRRRITGDILRIVL